MPCLKVGVKRSTVGTWRQWEGGSIKISLKWEMNDAEGQTE